MGNTILYFMGRRGHSTATAMTTTMATTTTTTSYSFPPRKESSHLLDQLSSLSLPPLLQTIDSDSPLAVDSSTIRVLQRKEKNCIVDDDDDHVGRNKKKGKKKKKKTAAAMHRSRKKKKTHIRQSLWHKRFRLTDTLEGAAAAAGCSLAHSHMQTHTALFRPAASPLLSSRLLVSLWPLLYSTLLPHLSQTQTKTQTRGPGTFFLFLFLFLLLLLLLETIILLGIDRRVNPILCSLHHSVCARVERRVVEDGRGGRR